MAAAHQPQSQGSISITLTGKALSEDLLLADTGTIALSPSATTQTPAATR